MRLLTLSLPLAPFLFVAEMMRDGDTGAANSVYLSDLESDPRYAERLVPNVIEELELDLYFEIIEGDGIGLQLVRRADVVGEPPIDWEVVYAALDKELGE